MGRWANKYVIGLTGNIGMGKSLVRTMLQHLGAYTIDADGLAHQVMAPGAPAYQPVIETFGKWILDAENKIDRSKLGAVAFSHPDALARLEALTHPIVGQGIDTLVSRAKQPIVVIEAIKLIEGALGAQVDAIWVVDTAPQIQLERLIQRRGMAEYEARKRIETQNPQREKLAKANLVISNNGTPEDVYVQVQREWQKITAARGVAEPQEETFQVTVSQKAQDRAQQQAQVAAQPAPAAPPPAPIAPIAPTTDAPTLPTRPTSPQRPEGLPTAPTTQPTPSPIQPLPVPAQPAPTAQPPAPAAPAASGSQQMTITTLTIRRGMPKHATDIANLLNKFAGKSLTREDVMRAFGEKSYLLAEAETKIVGVTGFQVENLITRMDELVIIPEAPIPPVAEAMINAIEEASKALQSEVGFMFVPQNAPNLVQSFVDSGYDRVTLDDIKVPAWREAAVESMPPNSQILTKKLRAERVLKPL